MARVKLNSNYEDFDRFFESIVHVPRLFVMLNLRDLIFSQETVDNSQALSSPSRPNYDDDEYVDYPDEDNHHHTSVSKARNEYGQEKDLGSRKMKKRRRGSKYLGAAPLWKGKGSKEFCSMYNSTPEIAYSKGDLSCSDTNSVARSEVWLLYCLDPTWWCPFFK